jgi:hypothetical protein
VYCGGTYRGLINNLDYIEDMGFSAVFIHKDGIMTVVDGDIDLDFSSNEKY